MSKIDSNRGLIKIKSLLFISVYYNPENIKNNIQLGYYKTQTCTAIKYNTEL